MVASKCGFGMVWLVVLAMNLTGAAEPAVKTVADERPLPDYSEGLAGLLGPFRWSLVEFRAGEIISYDWFRGGPGKLDGRILFDLAPYFAGEKAIAPGVTKPVFRLTIDGKGGWKILIKRDGRNGFKGSANDADWDHVFTHQSPGAKPYSVNVTRENSRWAMSTFSPGGSPEESSEVIVGLNPFHRDTGADAPWPERNRRVHSMAADVLDKALAEGTVDALGAPSSKRRERKP